MDIEATLRERIVRRDIPPGSRLREEALAAEFGVSRSRVREALATLQCRNLVERTPNRGAVVTRLDAAQVFKIYDVFEVLEGLSARLAAQNVPPEHWDDLIELFGDRLERAIREADYETYLHGVETYRSRVITAADNPLLTATLQGIYDQTAMIMRRVLILPGRGEQSLSEHRAVLAAFKRGDGDEAERLKRKNMDTGRKLLEKYHHFVI